MDVIDGSPLTYIGLYSTFPPMINSLQHDPERLWLDVEYLDDVVLLLREAAEEHGLEHGRRHRQEHAVTAEDLEISIRFGELIFSDVAPTATNRVVKHDEFQKITF